MNLTQHEFTDLRYCCSLEYEVTPPVLVSHNHLLCPCDVLQVGDEITHINGYSVVDASHREVVQLMREASVIGEVILSIRRNPAGPREVIIHRPNMQTSFGFVLQSNDFRTSCKIGE